MERDKQVAAMDRQAVLAMTSAERYIVETEARMLRHCRISRAF